MVFITRRESFNAAHRLFRPDFSDEENLRVFGKCSNPRWHGHNYILYVTVGGEVDEKTGFVMNLKQLSSVIQKSVIEKLDHRNINLEVDFMKDKLASAENLAVAIWEELDADIQSYGATLHKILLYETENNFVEYYGKSK